MQQIYRNANSAYDALSMRLGDQVFFFDNRYLRIVGLCLFLILFLTIRSWCHWTAIVKDKVLLQLMLTRGLLYRPTEVDALFLGHVLFVLHVLPVNSWFLFTDIILSHKLLFSFFGVVGYILSFKYFWKALTVRHYCWTPGPPGPQLIIHLFLLDLDN